MKIMILGVSGMLGNAMFKVLSADKSLQAYGTVRSSHALRFFTEKQVTQIVTDVDVESYDSLVRAFSLVRPNVVINCVGLVKQLADANNPLHAVPLNTLLPHRLSALCEATGSRLVHISTDCVFSGTKGNYLETDFPDANDLYGRSKLLGEVTSCSHVVTLRTSIIGHELSGQRSLIGWFLSQSGDVKGFTQALFSGLPTVELSKVVRDFVLSNPSLSGLYHVAAKPINKFELLNLVAKVYKKDINIFPSEDVVINRSLNADKFFHATGYIAPEWQRLIQDMYESN